MDIKNLRDEEIFNVAILLADMQDHVINEIRSRSKFNNISPIRMNLDIANNALKQINRFTLDAFGFNMACSYGEVSDKLFDRIINIILSEK